MGVIIALIVAFLLALGTAFGVVAAVNAQDPASVDASLVSYGER